MKKKFSFLLILSLVFLVACSNLGEEPEITVEENQEEVGTTGEDDSLEKVLDKGKIVIGTAAGYPPYAFIVLEDGKEKFVGSEIDLANFIGEELGVEVEVVNYDFDALIGTLNSGMIDAIVAFISETPERDINFTNAYYEAGSSLLIPEGQDIKELDDLNGKHFGVLLGSVQEVVLQELQEKYPEMTIESLPNVDQLTLNLKAGKYDGVLNQLEVSENYASVNDDLDIASVVFPGEEQVSIGLQKGADSLTEKLNEVVEKVNAGELYSKWVTEADKLSEEALID